MSLQLYSRWYAAKIEKKTGIMLAKCSLCHFHVSLKDGMRFPWSWHAAVCKQSNRARAAIKRDSDEPRHRPCWICAGRGPSRFLPQNPLLAADLATAASGRAAIRQRQKLGSAPTIQRHFRKWRGTFPPDARSVFSGLQLYLMRNKTFSMQFAVQFRTLQRVS